MIHIHDAYLSLTFLLQSKQRRIFIAVVGVDSAEAGDSIAIRHWADQEIAKDNVASAQQGEIESVQVVIELESLNVTMSKNW